jgi:phage tail sheath protein FI
MPFSLSPGVNFTETDLTGVVPQVATTGGGFVGDFLWGPVLIPTLVQNGGDLVSQFWQPGANNYESFFSASNFLDYGNNLQLVRVIDTSARNASANVGVLIRNDNDYNANAAQAQLSTNAGPFAARYPGVLGNSIEVSACPAGNAFSNTLTSTANVTQGNNFILFSSNVQPVLTVGDILVIGTNPGLQVTSIANTNVAVSGTVTASATNATVVRNWEYYRSFDSAPATSVWASTLGGSNDEVHVIVVDATGAISGTPGTVLEKYPYLSVAGDALNTDGTNQFYATAIFNQSKWIHWTGHFAGGTNWGSKAQNTSFTLVQKPYDIRLVNGVDSATPTVGQIQSGYDLFSNAEAIDVGLLFTGPWPYTVASYVMNNIAEVRLDCVVFTSPAKSDVVQALGQEVTNVTLWRNNLNISTSYGFADSGWKYQYDKYNDLYRWVPLNPDTAGLCARTDLTNDPWWSPAGDTRGQIKNVVKLAWSPSKAQRDLIYPLGVNPVVTFPSSGTELYGDRTLLTRPSAFDRINVRRLFIVLEKSIAIAARQELFEFNDAFTQAQFKGMIEPFLRDVQGRRGVTDYLVVCDGTNNTSDVVDNNEFVADIYVKPARSINFITLNFVATATGVQFDEVVGTV